MLVAAVAALVWVVAAVAVAPVPEVAAPVSRKVTVSEPPGISL